MNKDSHISLSRAISSARQTVPPLPDDCPECGTRMEFRFDKPDEDDPRSYRACICGVTVGRAK